MARKDADEMKIEVLQVVEEAGENLDCSNQLEIQTQNQIQQHPYAFHVSGPRNVPTINWRDLINSTWLVQFVFSAFFRFFCCCISMAVLLFESSKIVVCVRIFVRNSRFCVLNFRVIGSNELICAVALKFSDL